MNPPSEARLGEIPKEVVTTTRGFPTHRTAPDGDIPVMSVADLRNGSAPRHFANPRAVREAGLDLAEAGDVLIAIEGGTVGETFIVSDETRPFVPSQQVATLRVTNPDVLDPWYLGAWFATDQAREQIRRLARGMGILRIPIRELASLTVKLLPLSVQRDIGRRYIAFETAIQAHNAVAACLQDLRRVDLVVAFSDATDRDVPSSEDGGAWHGQ